MSATKTRDEAPKKEYERPRVIHVEKLEARAVACLKVDDFVCAGGPLNS